MYDVDGKTAVITGAASGMGLGMARSFAAAGMKVVLADIDAEGLASAVEGLKADGHAAIGLPTDVSKEPQIQALAKRRSTSSARFMSCRTMQASASRAPSTK